MKFKKFLPLVLTATMALTLLAGCGGASKETGNNSSNGNNNGKTTITFWHSMGGVNGEALTHLVDKFNSENDKGIHVDAQYQGEYDDSINKLKSAQLGNMGADLVQIYDIGTRFMIDSGYIVPMQELIDKDNYDISKIEPNIAAYYTVDKKLYSMPFNSSTPILYYNKDMFAKAGIKDVPQSFSQIESISGDLKSKGGAANAISLGIYGWFFEEFIAKQGLKYADNGNGRQGAATAVDFDKNGAALSILNSWNSLYDKGCTANVGRGGDAGLADFSAGKSAMTLGSTASLKQILTDVNGKFEVGTAYFPTAVDGSKGGVSIGGASLWALDNKDDAKKKATWEFVKFLISPESQAYWNANTGYFPVTTDAQNEQVYKDNINKFPQFKTAVDQLHSSSPEYAGALLSVFPEARQTVETEIENMLNGKQTPEETVKAMADSINKSIGEYNKINK
ncbi:MAG: ABC transporter substrate-binding protein [Clostridium beijerinckii]|nr:ABC transporter substrate-binding protein [Clostridium beijerinckii]